MVLDQLQDCCDFAVSALDGMYGWASEIVSIAIFVFFFNFLNKRLLKFLHVRFEKQGKIWKDSFVRALYTPLSSFVWFFAILQSLDLIASRIYHELPIVQRHTLIALAGLFCFAWFLLRWKAFVVQYIIIRCKNKELAFDPGKVSALNKLATVGIIFFSILILMEITDRSVNTIIAFGGVGGLAFAFASQEIIANFFGGFMIYLTQPFTINDWILIPDHNIEGYVEEIGWYMTRIRSLDKRPIYIPNSIFSKLIVITPSRMSHRQIKEIIGVRSEDLGKIKSIVKDLKAMLQLHPDLDHRQPIIARLSGFGQFSLDITVNVYTQTTGSEGFMQIKEDILLKIAEVIETNHAQLATPTQNIAILESINSQINKMEAQETPLPTSI